MKNTPKRLFALTFVLLVLLSLVPFSAFSAGSEITSIALIRENYTVGTTTDSWVIGIVYFIPLPQGADDSGVRLYYADTDEPVTVYDKEKFDDNYVRYVFEKKGIYQVYAMDSKTGVRSKTIQFNISKFGADKILALPDKMPALTAGEPFLHQHYKQIYNMVIHEIRLYYADTNLPVEMNADSRYIIDEPGEYRAYYMDGISGVKSEEFTLTVKSPSVPETPDNPQTSDRILILINFALLALSGAYSALKSRKFE